MPQHTLQRHGTPKPHRAGRLANTFFALFLAVLGSLGVTGVATADTSAVQAPCGDTAGFTQVDLSALPPEAADTVGLIQSGGPYPYPEDGGVFENREGILPDCETGYYHEFTVETPGSEDRGARRFVTGEGGEYFYTEDHYESFRLTNVNA